MESALEYQLKLIRWTFFGTLTWKESTLGSCRSREREVWEYFRKWAAELKTKLVDLPIALRWERGEVGDRPHAHFLLLQQRKHATIAQCFWHMHRWDVIGGYGFARIRLYDPTHDLEHYTAKDLAVCSDASKRNAYEVPKFDRADRVCINDAAWRMMCNAAGAKHAPQLRAS